MARPRFTILSNRTFHVLGVRHMIRKRAYTQQHEQIQLYSYKICTTTPYCSARNVSKTLRCSSTHSINTLPDRNMEAGAGYQGCLPSCELHIHNRRSLSGGLAKWKFVDCTCKLCNLEIAHVCYAISRLEHNLRILRMRNAISRLRRFSACTEHMYLQVSQRALETGVWHWRGGQRRVLPPHL